MTKPFNSLIVFISFFILSNCAPEGPIERSWGKMKNLQKMVGNMNDTSYSTVRNQEPRLNALNQAVAIEEFEGQYVWAEYAATWCKPCSWQALEAKKADTALDGQITFITIMTGKSTKYNDHATVATAESWANRFNLDPENVFAANLWFKTVPEHRFFSPKGHTLFVHVGTLTAIQIKDIILFYKEGYEIWDQGGDAPGWMTFQ